MQDQVMKTVRTVRDCLIIAVFAFTAAPAWSRAGETATVYLTAKNTPQRIAKMSELEWTELPQPPEKIDVIFLDPSKTFQTVVGIGGALTDASAETFFKLPAAKQQELIEAYFDPQNGIGYSLGRTNIHSCDFSSDSYTYVAEGDTELKTFDVEHDRQYRIPFIRKALETAGRDFKLFASPWSPPAWMKDNHDMLHGGSLKREFYPAWANYFVRFIQAYAAEGIPIWAVTVQNEPMAVQTWESCVFTAQEERDFVKDHLGPTLEKSGLRSTKIIVWDHNRTMMYHRASTILNDPEAARFVWGVGFHWYVDDTYNNVRLVQEAFPNTHLIFTEGCHGPFDRARLDEWHWGEAYARAIINDFNNGAVGWTDWNVLLDETGGPNHVSNFCFAPVIGSTETGDLTYMSSFYYIGHFSKFIRPAAKRIISSPTVDNLPTTAFVNPDGSIVVIVMNETDRDHPFMIWLREKMAATHCPPHSIMTVVID
jgi:glucosylceramidase